MCRLWDTGTREVEVTFTGHKTAVSCLALDRAGLRLVSGSRDTAVIVWDVVAECGIARLQGHKVRADTYLYLHLLTRRVGAWKLAPILSNIFTLMEQAEGWLHYTDRFGSQKATLESN